MIEQLVIEHKNGLKNFLNIIRKSNIRIRIWSKFETLAGNYKTCYTVSAHMNKDSYVELYDDIKQPLACGAKAANFY